MSALFEDVFRSRDGAFEESRSVFVEGVRLAESARDRSRFTVLELGFGLGVNFLATVEAWLKVAPAAARLDFVSIEKHPLSAVDLARAHEALGLSCARSSAPWLETRWAEQLRANWPPATPDLHRIAFADGRVCLWLALGDAAYWLPQLRLAADAIYLDGFSPARNPQCWTPAIIKALARHCRRGTRLATFSAARPVREALSAAGFELSLVPGFGRKRERIDAHYAPRWTTWAEPPLAPSFPSREALVIGAGLAGTAVAARLSRLGWSVTLIDEAGEVMSGGSAQPLCADHLHVSIDDNLTARASRAALFLAQAHRAQLPNALPRGQKGRLPQEPSGRFPHGQAGEFARGAAAPSPGGPSGPLFRDPTGRLHLPIDGEETERLRECVRGLAFPESLLQWVDAEQASSIAGERLATGGLWMPGCDLVDPALLGHARLQAAGERLRFIPAAHVDALQRRGDQWGALDRQGRLIAEAPVVVLCNAGDLNRLAGLRSIPLRSVRGQTSWLAPSPLPELRCVLGGPAYAAPWQGRLLIGATFDESENVAPDRDSDLSNLRRFARMVDADLPALGAQLSSAAVGFRWTSTDRLPLIGALPDELAARSGAHALLRNAKLPLPRRAGLYCVTGLGSRGSLWSELGAECIAALLEGTIYPIATEIAEALDPARHLRRHLRRAAIH